MGASPAPGEWGADSSDTQGGIDTVRIKFTAGTAGAVPTFPLSMSEFVTSVTKSGTTGQYDIVFQNNDYQLGGFTSAVIQASFAADGAHYAVVTAYSDTAGTATVQFCKGSDGSAVYLASGDVAILTFARQRYKSQMG